MFWLYDRRTQQGKKTGLQTAESMPGSAKGSVNDTNIPPLSRQDLHQGLIQQATYMRKATRTEMLLWTPEHFCPHGLPHVIHDTVLHMQMLLFTYLKHLLATCPFLWNSRQLAVWIKHKKEKHTIKTTIKTRSKVNNLKTPTRTSCQYKNNVLIDRTVAIYL